MLVKKIDTDHEAFELTIIARRHHDELGNHLPFSESHTFANAKNIANSKESTGFLAWLCVSDFQTIGYLVGSITPYLFSNALRADQHIWFVDKDYRSTRAAYMMFKAFEEYATKLGCLELIGGVEMENSDFAEKVETLFPRMGFKRTGATFNKLIGHNNG